MIHFTKKLSNAPMRAGPAWSDDHTAKLPWAKWFNQPFPQLYTVEWPVAGMLINVNHALNTTSVLVQVYEVATGILTQPSRVTIIDANNLTLEFGAPFLGYAVVVG